MAIDRTLLGILACPEDKGPLLLVEDELLYNPRLRRAYPIEGGIPVLLVDDARDVDDAEHESILSRATSGS
ncbi:Trm112 family protein [Rhodococcus sp. BGS-1C]|uniref:Trm112 family protein n=1 Tax=Nocardiaceae TaxID=85025 RepID=UPI00095D7043|nr:MULTISPECIES: Trm112 family protein [Rhodococcus]MCC8927614.1 Trm112 family protein [Rhodococcus sp. I2R]MCZ4278421.1 Trm112 family protein [Rhodococcus yunnanensis]OLT32236.1 protein YcaR in KDO2-Lipid A biosynthesis cluster [Rhodococcus sp. CUA-806]